MSIRDHTVDSEPNEEEYALLSSHLIKGLMFYMTIERAWPALSGDVKNILLCHLKSS